MMLGTKLLSFILERYSDNDSMLIVDIIDRLLHPFHWSLFYMILMQGGLIDK